MRRTVIQNPETVKKALDAFYKSKHLTVSEVARATGIGWQQARSLLLLLVTEGKLRVTQPSGFCFELKADNKETCQE